MVGDRDISWRSVNCAAGAHGVHYVQYQYIMQSIHADDHAPLNLAVTFGECIKKALSALATAETMFDVLVSSA